MPRRPKVTRAQTELARSARKTPSVAEQIAWKLLRKERTGFIFRREHVVLNYRLDFYCPNAKLAVEFDGEQHDSERDSLRDADLRELGIETYRIPNREFFHIDAEGKLVDHINTLIKKCKERTV